MFLGALFGYFFYWTGNLWVPIAAHVFNNGFAVVMFYLYHRGAVGEELVEMKEVPLIWVLVSLLLTTVFLIYFKKQAVYNKDK